MTGPPKNADATAPRFRPKKLRPIHKISGVPRAFLLRRAVAVKVVRFATSTLKALVKWGTWLVRKARRDFNPEHFGSQALIATGRFTSCRALVLQ